MLGADRVSYVPTINLAQGIAAILAFDSSQTMEENTTAMTESGAERHIVRQ
mgnify:CR=1 FL=1